MTVDPVPAVRAVVATVTRRSAPLLVRARHLSMSLSARALEASAKFGLYALAARLLGGHDSGRFFLALGVIQIVSTIARLGLEKPVTRHIAAELAVGDIRAARLAAWQALAAIVTASALAGLLLAITAPVLAHHWSGQANMAPVLVLAGLIVPIQNLAFAVAYILTGLERGGAGQMVMNALPPVLTLAALCLGADSLNGLLLAYAASFGLCGLLGAMLIVTTRWSRRPGRRDPAPPLASLWHGARQLLIVDVSQAALLTIPVLVLAAFAEPTDVSVFSLCSRLSMLVTIVVLSLGAMSAPHYARHHRLGDWTALDVAARDNRRATVALCLPLIAALAIGAVPLLRLLGVPADVGTPVLLILLAGQLAYCLLPSRDLLLAMAGEERILRWISLAQVTGCIGLCLVLTPPFGVTGAALASATIWIAGAWAVATAAKSRLPMLSL